MTTPPPPAGWYTEPDGSGGSRYWDGTAWTEHRSPGAPAAASDEPSSPTAADPVPAGHDSDGYQKPVFDMTFERPPFESISAGPAASRDDVEASPEAPSPEPTAWHTADDRPTESVPASLTEPYTAPEPPTEYLGEPVGAAAPSRPANDRKLIIGFSSTVGVLLVIMIAIFVYAFVIRGNNQTIASPSVSMPTTASLPPTDTSTSPSTTPSGQVANSGATDGPFTFEVTDSETVDTVASASDPTQQKKANGTYFVVHLNISNTSQDPQTFMSADQQLTANGTVFTPDVDATTYLGGGAVQVAPGDVVATSVAFDVPVGTTPTSVVLHGIPGGAGIEIPL